MNNVLEVHGAFMEVIFQVRIGADSRLGHFKVICLDAIKEILDLLVHAETGEVMFHEAFSNVVLLSVCSAILSKVIAPSFALITEGL